MCWTYWDSNYGVGSGGYSCGSGMGSYFVFPAPCDLILGNCPQCSQLQNVYGLCRLDWLWAEGIPSSQWPLICANIGEQIQVLPGPGCSVSNPTSACTYSMMDCSGFDPEAPGAMCYHITGDQTSYYGQFLGIPCNESVFYSLNNISQCAAHGESPPTTAQLCGWMTEDMNAVGCPLPPNPPGTLACQTDQADMAQYGCP
jgi:hypothetical protein